MFVTRLLLLHLAKLGRPGNVRRLVGRHDTEESGVVYEEVEVWKILGRPDQVARMVVVLDRTEGSPLCTQKPDPERARLSSMG